MSKKKCYISGPMTGFNRDIVRANFAVGEALMKAQGYKVVNPAKFWMFRFAWLYKLMGYTYTLLYDFWRVSRCDTVCMLPGYMSSPGATAERAYAMGLKKTVIDISVKDFCQARDNMAALT